MAPGDQCPPRLRVTVSDERGRPVRFRLAGWLARAAPPSARGSVHVALVSNPCVRTLNRRYRGQDYATDVLSFPAWEKGRRRGLSARGVGEVCDLLGDIVIARAVARQQAHKAGHSETTELRVLALHGLLHLLGYDHERRDDRGAMARLEHKLGRRAGLHTGLIDRP